jgi:hypothetical protein
MTKWIVAAVTLGILATMFVIGAVSTARTVHDRGVQLITGPSGRFGITTADKTGSMAFAALVCGLGCLGSVLAVARANKRTEDVSDNDRSNELEPGAWICPHCHEVNPGNFEECWKCRRNRQQGSSA